MLSYIIQGIWTAKNSVLLGLAIFIIAECILIISKKRTLRDFKIIPKYLLLSELLLSIYICTILNITGIIGRKFSYDFSLSELGGLIVIPFVGASIKMITLNFLLFIPYGVLVYIVFFKYNLNLGKAFFVGFISSLIIEIIQAFTGRMAEIDDLIANTAGFIVGFLIAEGCYKIVRKNKHKNGIIQIVLTMFIPFIIIFALSFIANGDKIQDEENAYYNGIASPEGTLNDEISSIIEMNIYRNNIKYNALKDDADWQSWYTSMGIDINNRSGLYNIDNVSNISSKEFIDSDKTYVEIMFKTPQTFRFYNNHSWEMDNVQYFLYCLENGNLCYGTEKDSIIYLAQYDISEYQYDVDEDLVNDINEWLK